MSLAKRVLFAYYTPASPGLSQARPEPGQGPGPGPGPGFLWAQARLSQAQALAFGPSQALHITTSQLKNAFDLRLTGTKQTLPGLSAERYKKLCQDIAKEVEFESTYDPGLMERRKAIFQTIVDKWM